jgi:hypothetical protein
LAKNRIALIDTDFGEQKAQSCAIAWLQHLRVPKVAMSQKRKAAQTIGRHGVRYRLPYFRTKP